MSTDETTDNAETWTDEPPAARMVGERLRMVRTITVQCPFCDMRHEHVWGKGPTERTRMSHCKRGRRAYWVTVPA